MSVEKKISSTVSRPILAFYLFFLLLGMIAARTWPEDLPFFRLLFLFSFSSWGLSILFRRRRSCLLSAPMTVVFLGYALMTFSLSPPTKSALARYSGQPCRIEGKVLGLPRDFDGGFSMKMDCLLVEFNGRREKVNEPLLLRVYDGHPSTVSPGDTIKADLIMDRPRGTRFPGGWNGRITLAGEKVYFTAGVTEGPKLMMIDGPASLVWRPILFVRSKISELLSSLEQPANGILNALLLGQRQRVGDDLQRAFRLSGLSHILAVSGLHVGLVGLLFYGGGFFLLRRVHTLTMRLDARRLAAAISILPTVAYTVVTGGQPPAVRACVMALLVFLGLAVGRQAESLNSLFLAALVILLSSPPTLFSPSFQLSFAAVLAIIGAVRSFPRLFEEEGGGVVGRIGWKFMRYFSISAAAALGAIPLAGYHFSLFTPSGIVASVLAVPLCATIILPFGLVACLISLINQPLARLIIIPSTWGTMLLADLALLVSGIEKMTFRGFRPSPAQVIGLYMLVTAAFLCRKRSGKYLLLFGLVWLASATLLISSLDKGVIMRVTFLDVGQGDAALIEVPGRRSWLVDAGGRTGSYDRGERIIIPFLLAKRINELSALIISHPHPDHVGGVPSVIETISCPEIWHDTRNGNLVVEELKDRGKECLFRSFGRGDSLHFREGSFFFFNPAKEECDERPTGDEAINDSSLAFVFRRGGGSVIFTGDVGNHVLQEMSESCLSRSDLLKVPHHGSRKSFWPYFYERVDPEWAIITAGPNPFGHPHGDVMEELRIRGTRLFITGYDGTVEFSYKHGKWKEKIWRGVKNYLSPSGFWHWFIAGY